MIIYKCDVCDKVTADDVIPPDWSAFQLTIASHGNEAQMGKVKHLCNDHTLQTLIDCVKAHP